jgi:tRNA dimethylallyltransferase
VTPPAIAAIVGPTASGKSALAMALAARLPLEIISADSRQVYRGMDIGTAKPTDAERAAVPHHLVDVAAPDEPFTVAQWAAAARALLPEIAARGHLPLLVGGTGLYVSALLEGFDFARQAWSPQIRRRLSEEATAAGVGALAERLAQLAPDVAAHTDLRNPRRVLRALERASAGDLHRPGAVPYGGPVTVIGLWMTQEALDARIAARAEGMFAGGLLAETRRLLDAGHDRSLPSLSGHGYREAAGVLDGSLSEPEAIRATTLRVRRYARRQMSWFRRDPRVRWLPADEPRLVDTALALLPAS